MLLLLYGPISTIFRADLLVSYVRPTRPRTTIRSIPNTRRFKTQVLTINNLYSMVSYVFPSSFS